MGMFDRVFMDTAEKRRFFLMISAVEFFSAPVRLLVVETKVASALKPAECDCYDKEKFHACRRPLRAAREKRHCISLIVVNIKKKIEEKSPMTQAMTVKSVAVTRCTDHTPAHDRTPSPNEGAPFVLETESMTPCLRQSPCQVAGD
jgi:hypothetical protein